MPDLSLLDAFVSFGVEGLQEAYAEVDQFEARVEQLTEGDQTVSVDVQATGEFDGFLTQIDGLRDRLDTLNDDLRVSGQEFQTYEQLLDSFSPEELFGVFQGIREQLGELTEEENQLLLEVFGVESVVDDLENVEGAAEDAEQQTMNLNTALAAVSGSLVITGGLLEALGATELGETVSEIGAIGAQAAAVITTLEQLGNATGAFEIDLASATSAATSFIGSLSPASLTGFGLGLTVLAGVAIESVAAFQDLEQSSAEALAVFERLEGIDLDPITADIRELELAVTDSAAAAEILRQNAERVRAALDDPLSDPFGAIAASFTDLDQAFQASQAEEVIQGLRDALEEAREQAAQLADEAERDAFRFTVGIDQEETLREQFNRIQEFFTDEEISVALEFINLQEFIDQGQEAANTIEEFLQLGNRDVLDGLREATRELNDEYERTPAVVAAAQEQIDELFRAIDQDPEGATRYAEAIREIEEAINNFEAADGFRDQADVLDEIIEDIESQTGRLQSELESIFSSITLDINNLQGGTAQELEAVLTAADGLSEADRIQEEIRQLNQEQTQKQDQQTDLLRQIAQRQPQRIIIKTSR